MGPSCLVLLITVQVIWGCEGKWWGCPCAGPVMPPGHGPMILPQPPGPMMPPYGGIVPPPSYPCAHQPPITIPVRYVALRVIPVNNGNICQANPAYQCGPPNCKVECEDTSTVQYDCSKGQPDMGYHTREDFQCPDKGYPTPSQPLRLCSPLQQPQPPAPTQGNYQMQHEVCQPTRHCLGVPPQPALNPVHEKPCYQVPSTPTHCAYPRYVLVRCPINSAPEPSSPAPQAPSHPAEIPGCPCGSSKGVPGEGGHTLYPGSCDRLYPVPCDRNGDGVPDPCPVPCDRNGDGVCGPCPVHCNRNGGGVCGPCPIPCDRNGGCVCGPCSIPCNRNSGGVCGPCPVHCNRNGGGVCGPCPIPCDRNGGGVCGPCPVPCDRNGDGVPGLYPVPGDGIQRNPTLPLGPNTPLCLKHYVVRSLHPVYDECIKKVPIVQQVVRHEPVTSVKTVSCVKRKVYNKPEQYICHVPVVEKRKVSEFQYRTKMVPCKKTRIVPTVETFVVNVPVTEKVQEALYKDVVKHVPRICYRMKPVLQEEVVRIPMETRSYRPVMEQQVISVPVKSRIRKDFIEQRVEKAYGPCDCYPSQSCA